MDSHKPEMTKERYYSHILSKKNILFLLIIICVLFYYIAGIIFPDGNIIRHRNDESYFHLKVLKKMADSNISDTIKDYPAATFPLFHLLAAPVYKLWPENVWILRNINLVLTFLTAFLIFYYFLSSTHLTQFYDRSAIAFSISLTFILSPFVRASALSVTTDNLPYLFIITGLIMFHYYEKTRKMILIPLIVLLSFFSFYTRQYYIWVPILFFVKFFKLDSINNRLKILYFCISLLFMIPAIYLWTVWGGLVPPAFQTHHETSRMLMIIPFIFSFIPFYFIPVYFLYFREIRTEKINWKSISIIIAFAFLYCFIYMKNSFTLRIVDGGGISSLVLSNIFGQHAPLPFLIFSYLGLITIIFFIIKDSGQIYLWMPVFFTFLLSRVFWQKYFDPLIVFLIFITMSPSLKERMTKTRFILLYPFLEVLLFAGITILYLKKTGLP